VHLMQRVFMPPMFNLLTKPFFSVFFQAIAK
jgi:hypothetical protein